MFLRSFLQIFHHLFFCSFSAFIVANQISSCYWIAYSRITVNNLLIFRDREKYSVDIKWFLRILYKIFALLNANTYRHTHTNTHAVLLKFNNQFVDNFKHFSVQGVNVNWRFLLWVPITLTIVSNVIRKFNIFNRTLKTNLIFFSRKETTKLLISDK